MAKKSRTPPPPRKVQAPKTRTDPKKPTDRRRYLVAIGAGVAAVVVLAVVLGVVLASGGGGGGAGDLTSLGETMRAAGCSFTTVTSSPSAQHIQSLDDKVTYNSYPPTSGHHYFQPAIWNDYSQTVNPKQAVHNQEHGGVVIWYGPRISAENRSLIDEFYNESPEAMLVTPLANSTPGITYPSHKPLGSKVALTAWDAPNGAGHGVVAVCPSVNLKAFQTFRDTVRGQGPEHFPVSSLQPGT